MKISYSKQFIGFLVLAVALGLSARVTLDKLQEIDGALSIPGAITSAKFIKVGM